VYEVFKDINLITAGLKTVFVEPVFENLLFGEAVTGKKVCGI
jgi:hypothetical protein